MHPAAEHSPLGKSSEYISTYTPSLLFPIPRAAKWAELGLSAETLPYKGVDFWNCFELSWLLPSGKPVSVRIRSLAEIEAEGVMALPGVCIDELDISVSNYEHPRPELLRCDQSRIVEEGVHSHLLKSNCPVTSQPDWGSVVVEYRGRALDHASLLEYIVSFRQHSDFHEQCVERIFLDLQRLLKPEKLTVYARYVRRGGLDINPYRSTEDVAFQNVRLARQ